jgi:hypothetical protein
MENKPNLSPEFTVEDIRKIRDHNNERYAGMTRSEIAEDINNGAREFEALVEEARQKPAQRSAYSV